jgi:hypothetical protein
MARKASHVDKEMLARMNAAGRKRQRAMSALDDAIAELDDVIRDAYFKGVPILRIQKECDTTRPTVRAALRRSGVDI